MWNWKNGCEQVDMLWCQGAQNMGLSNNKLTCSVWSQCTPVPDRQTDRRTNVKAIARRFILTNAYRELKYWNSFQGQKPRSNVIKILITSRRHDNTYSQRTNSAGCIGLRILLLLVRARSTWLPTQRQSSFEWINVQLLFFAAELYKKVYCTNDNLRFTTCFGVRVFHSAWNSVCWVWQADDDASF